MIVARLYESGRFTQNTELERRISAASSLSMSLAVPTTIAGLRSNPDEGMPPEQRPSTSCDGYGDPAAERFNRVAPRKFALLRLNSAPI
jgi:hypothetical protein